MKSNDDQRLEIEKQIDIFTDKMWRKGYDGVFRSHLIKDDMPAYNCQGVLNDVLKANHSYLLLLNKINLLFPLTIRTWWNHDNKGSIACEFKIELQANKVLTVSRFSIERIAVSGNVLAELTILLPTFQKMPDKSLAVFMVTIPKLLHKKCVQPKL
jgi:hypothetical protein